LRMFAEGISSLPNKLLADVCDYLWGFWSHGDPAGLWFHRPACRFAGFPSTIVAWPGVDPDCECWDL
jgi:hypothetical protein